MTYQPSKHKYGPARAQLLQEVKEAIRCNDHTLALVKCAEFCGTSADFYRGILLQISAEEERLKYVTPDMEKIRAVVTESMRKWGELPPEVREVI